MELNPFSYAFHEDSYQTCPWLREHTPLSRNDRLDSWALSRFADAMAAFVDWKAEHRVPRSAVRMCVRISEACGLQDRRVAGSHGSPPRLVAVSLLDALIPNRITPRRRSAERESPACAQAAGGYAWLLQ